jgi:hypothetical protein
MINKVIDFKAKRPKYHYQNQGKHKTNQRKHFANEIETFGRTLQK